MSEHDQSQREPAKSDADQTLLGVAPPRIDSSVETLQRAPVYVRSGTSVADGESVPTSRAPLSNSPLRVSAGSAELPAREPVAAASGFGEQARRLARQRPVLWMVLAPLLAASVVLLLGRHGSSRANRVAAPTSAEPAQSAAIAAEPMHQSSIAELEAKPPESLTAQELLRLAAANSERQIAAASELRHKLEQDPALGKDSALQAELQRLAGDQRTARDALAGMAALEAPVGADLLYETWTGTAERSETTDLARALLYSGEVRSKASPALGVALQLRAAETCEQYRALLPEALKDGDRRSFHLLAKLSSKRGCGPKKSADCFACLRQPSDELTATINAAKSRRAPSYAAQ